MYHMLRNGTTDDITHLHAFIKPYFMRNLYFPKYFTSNLFTYSCTYSSHSRLHTR
jgi:hypothetical protein